MPEYRRWHGSMVFLTVVTAGRRGLFASPQARALLRNSIRQTVIERPWEMLGLVLLPDHLHMLWQMPDGDWDYSGRVSGLKKRFTQAYLAAGGQEAVQPAGQQRHRIRGVWQRRFWEHTIRDAKDFHMHLDYIHINPVKHGLVQRPGDWPWSTFAGYVKRGWYEADWCGRADLPGTVEYIWTD